MGYGWRSEEDMVKDAIKQRIAYGGKRYSMYHPESQWVSDIQRVPIEEAFKLHGAAVFSERGGGMLGNPFRVLMAEYIFHRRNNTTLFIPSKSFPKTLYDSTFDIDTSSFKVPFSGVMGVAFRDGIVVDGVRIRGCLFTSISRAMYKEYYHDMYMRCLRDLVPAKVRDILEHPEDNKEAHRVMDRLADAEGKAYCANHEVSGARLDEVEDSNICTLLFVGDDGMTVHSIFSSVDLLEVLNDQAYADKFNNKQAAMYEGLDSAEIHTLGVHVKLATAICCYISAFPSAVSSGSPGDFKHELRGFTPNEYTRVLSCGEHKDGVKVSMHFRRGHFATLRGDRYRHNPDGSPRIIFKRSCVVGADLDAHTLTRKK